MTSLLIYIEYDESLLDAANYKPFSGTIQVIDFTNVSKLTTGKPYYLISILTGARMTDLVKIHHQPRGLPMDVSYYVKSELGEAGQLSSWLTYDELTNLIDENNFSSRQMPLSFLPVIASLKTLNDHLGSRRVRMTYCVM